MFSCFRRRVGTRWQLGSVVDAIRTAMETAQASIDARYGAGDPEGMRGPSVMIEEVSMTVGVISRKNQPLGLAQNGVLSRPVTSVARRFWPRVADRLLGRIVQPILITVQRSDARRDPASSESACMSDCDVFSAQPD